MVRRSIHTSTQRDSVFFERDTRASSVRSSRNAALRSASRTVLHSHREARTGGNKIDRLGLAAGGIEVLVFSRNGTCADAEPKRKLQVAGG